MARTVRGKSFTWQISDAPIGSGDAGEVFAATCVEQPELIGVMKKPAKVATGGTIQRQANQIAQESLALERLNGLPLGKAHPPRLLDQAPEFTQGTANYFIVSETAPGDDLASLLAHSRQTGKPFPRRVIITVLDALFDLFARAHKAGVLWNDVKLEHIYWHNPTSQVAVIDWGNAIFLTQDEDNQHQRFPRWEDYVQMVNTLGGFLQQSAPELFADLGWDEFQEQKLDSPRVSILARRIAYQQQVISLKEMENQSLIRVVLSGDPTLQGLQNIQTYQQILEQIGAPWENTSTLEYSQSLVKASLAANETQTAVRATAIVFDLFGDSLGLSWHLLREYFRNPDIIHHNILEKLVNDTLNENWSGALWSLVSIARDVQNPSWWGQLAPVLRQKSIDSVTPPPYQTCQSLLTWAEGQGLDKANLTQSLMKILNEWRWKGDDLEESPFDYGLQDLLREETDLPHQIRSTIKISFAASEGAIRKLSQVWMNADWGGLSEAFRQVTAWDPDRWGIIRLAESVEVLKAWTQTLYKGPVEEVNISRFFQDLLNERPKVESLLGIPPWLNARLTLLNTLQQGASVSDFQPEVKKWCPWLLNYPDIHSTKSNPVIANDSSDQHVLTGFIGHIKKWSDLQAGLTYIKENAPAYHPYCSQLADALINVLSLNADLSQIESVCTIKPHTALAESSQALQSLLNWRKNLSNEDLTTAIQALNNPNVQGFRILEHAHQQTTLWLEAIAPMLNSLLAFKPVPETKDVQVKKNPLAKITHTCSEIRQIWNQVYDSGIHQRLLDTLESTIEQARNDFFNWRRSLEVSNDRVAHLLYHQHLEIIRKVSNNLLRLSQHSQQVKTHFSLIGEGAEASLTVQLHTAENILDHLGAIEKILVAHPDDRHFPEWQTAFRQLRDTTTAETRRQVVLSISNKHPLYTWLVQTIFSE